MTRLFKTTYVVRICSSHCCVCTGLLAAAERGLHPIYPLFIALSLSPPRGPSELEPSQNSTVGEDEVVLFISVF